MKQNQTTIIKILRSWISWIAVFSALFTGLIISGLNSYHLFNQIKDIQESVTREVAYEINSWFEDYFRKLLFISQIKNVLYDNSPIKSELINSILQSNSAIETLVLIDGNKNILFAQNNRFETDYNYIVDSLGFKVVTRQGEEFTSQANLSDMNEPRVIVSLPLRDNNDVINGVMQFQLNLKYLQYTISNIKIDFNGYAIIIDQNNHIIARNNNVITSILPTDYSFKYINLLNGIHQFHIYKGLGYEKVIGSYTRVMPTKWFLIVETPIWNILYKFRTSLIIILGAIILSIIFAYIISQRIYRYIYEPLNSLSEAAEQISQGNLNTVIDDIANNEFGNLAEAFNTMTGQLRRTFANLDNRWKFEHLISKVASEVIKPQTDNATNEMNTILEKICEYLRAARINIYNYNEEKDFFNCTHEWNRKDTKPLTDDLMCIPTGKFPILSLYLKKGLTFIMDVANSKKQINQLYTEIPLNEDNKYLQLSNTEEFNHLLQDGIAYLLAIPLFEAERLFSFIMITFRTGFERSMIPEADSLQTLSNMITTSLIHSRDRRLLNEERERLSITLHSIGDAVIAVRADGLVQLVNPVAAKLLGMEPEGAVNKKLYDIFHIYDAITREPIEKPIYSVISAGQIYNVDTPVVLINNQGKEFYISDSAAPIKSSDGQILGVVLVFRDDTEKFNRDIELLRIQKLEAVSLLSAGIAHDFNNLLTAILGNISLAIDLLPVDSEVASLLRAAESSTSRGKDITNQLLTYSKGNLPDRKSTSIGNLIEETVRFTLIGSKVDLKMYISPNLHNVNMASGIVNQILTNIFLNAIQAMDGKGTLTINAENIEIEDKPTIALKSGKYVKVTINDTGEGIAPENLANVYDPYFTTRESGMGLGLTSVYSLMKKHDGYVNITSKRKVGTTVELYFAIAEQQTKTPAPKSAAKLDKGGKAIVLEDDGLLLSLFSKVLNNLNLETDITTEKEPFFDLLEQSVASGKSYQIAIIDLTIAGGNSLLEFSQQVKKLIPNIILILTSGYTQHPGMIEYSRYGFTESLPKPFHISELKELITKFI